MRVWYRVRSLEVGRDFYTRTLGFVETAFDISAGWSELEHGEMKIALTEGEPDEVGVATVDVENVKAEADRLRAAGVEVGTVFELHGEVRLLDVYDPDGNRIQLAEDLNS